MREFKFLFLLDNLVILCKGLIARTNRFVESAFINELLEFYAAHGISV